MWEISLVKKCVYVLLLVKLHCLLCYHLMATKLGIFKFYLYWQPGLNTIIIKTPNVSYSLSCLFIFFHFIINTGLRWLSTICGTFLFTFKVCTMIKKVVDCYLNHSGESIVVLTVWLLLLMLYVVSAGSLARWRLDCGSRLSEWIPLTSTLPHSTLSCVSFSFALHLTTSPLLSPLLCTVF